MPNKKTPVYGLIKKPIVLEDKEDIHSDIQTFTVKPEIIKKKLFWSILFAILFFLAISMLFSGYTSGGIFFGIISILGCSWSFAQIENLTQIKLVFNKKGFSVYGREYLWTKGSAVCKDDNLIFVGILKSEPADPKNLQDSIAFEVIDINGFESGEKIYPIFKQHFKEDMEIKELYQQYCQYVNAQRVESFVEGVSELSNAIPSSTKDLASTIWTDIKNAGKNAGRR